MEATIKTELHDDAPLGASVEPLFYVKTELICQEENGNSVGGSFDEMEFRLATDDSAARGPMKEGPPDNLHEGAVEKLQDFHGISTFSNEAEDCKPLREHSADIGKYSSTQPPHGDWGICGENGGVGRVAEDAEGFDPASWALVTGTPRGMGFVNDAACDNGCSTDSDVTCDGKFGCSECKMQFKEKKFLMKHLKAHSGEDKYRCKVCDKRFGQLYTLNRHEKIHTGEKAFTCNVCGKQFSQYWNLTRHVGMHTGDKPFRCEVCSKRFTVSSHLKQHGRTHTGEKPFGCGACRARFSTSSDLTRHGKTHTGEKPFRCGVCHQRFSTSWGLARHGKMHTDDKPSHRCGVCGKLFSTPWSLGTHGATHTGVKPFQCEVCEKHFTRASTLKIHRKMHTREAELLASMGSGNVS